MCLCDGDGLAAMPEVPETDGAIVPAQNDQVRLVGMTVHALDGYVLVRAEGREGKGREEGGSEDRQWRRRYSPRKP